ncbi:thiamine-phosphate kinase [Metabacillus schmidteae]|uniref:thiamine-phosphate kinase n=1 Tax=Metabacillus schmidteae TaxID=2730405 RepID=UPI00158DC3F4|nr:thiamine-phosphate kinase [Metabacillus schmidteae]
MDEFDFINKIKPDRIFQQNVKVAIGDDAAVYESSQGCHQVVCVDTMVEGVHFLRNLSSPFEIGYKALAVNVSDLAAMSAKPLYYLISLAVPSNWHEKDLIEIYEGMKQISSEYKMDLLGGDTVSTSDKLVITVTVIGEVEKGRKTLRSNAKDEDIVFVTGTIGDSAAGLAILLGQTSLHNVSLKKYFIEKHKMPVPQVKAGRLVGELNRASLNDISDGLASELNEISEASQVGITLDEEALPISDELLTLQSTYNIQGWVLFGGEDYELVGTTSPDSWEKLKNSCHEVGIKITKIGIVDSSHKEVLLITKNQEYVKLEKSGYNHFKK